MNNTYSLLGSENSKESTEKQNLKTAAEEWLKKHPNHH